MESGSRYITTKTILRFRPVQRIERIQIIDKPPSSLVTRTSNLRLSRILLTEPLSAIRATLVKIRKSTPILTATRRRWFRARRRGRGRILIPTAAKPGREGSRRCGGWSWGVILAFMAEPDFADGDGAEGVAGGADKVFAVGVFLTGCRRERRFWRGRGRWIGIWRSGGCGSFFG